MDLWAVEFPLESDEMATRVRILAAKILAFASGAIVGESILRLVWGFIVLSRVREFQSNLVLVGANVFALAAAVLLARGLLALAQGTGPLVWTDPVANVQVRIPSKTVWGLQFGGWMFLAAGGLQAIALVGLLLAPPLQGVAVKDMAGLVAWPILAMLGAAGLFGAGALSYWRFHRVVKRAVKGSKEYGGDEMLGLATLQLISGLLMALALLPSMGPLFAFTGGVLAYVIYPGFGIALAATIDNEAKGLVAFHVGPRALVAQGPSMAGPSAGPPPGLPGPLRGFSLCRKCGFLVGAGDIICRNCGAK